jgi:hypothetical protein
MLEYQDFSSLDNNCGSPFIPPIFAQRNRFSRCLEDENGGMPGGQGDK